MALAALMRLGEAAPPAPKEFMADQMPGHEKLQRPTMVMLNIDERYHFTAAVLMFLCHMAKRGKDGTYLDVAGPWEARLRSYLGAVSRRGTHPEDRRIPSCRYCVSGRPDLGG